MHACMARPNGKKDRSNDIPIVHSTPQQDFVNKNTASAIADAVEDALEKTQRELKKNPEVRTYIHTYVALFILYVYMCVFV